MGPHLFVSGHLHWYRVGNVSLNICNAQSISDAEWAEYLRGVLELGKGEPTASITHFTGVLPNAAQRKLTADFVTLHRLPRISIAFLTDNAVARGAITAFGWVLPSARTRAFRPRDLDAAMDWLQTVTSFDRAETRRCVEEAWTALGARKVAS